MVSEERWAAISDIPVPAIDPRGAAILASAVIDQQADLARCADSIEAWIEGSSMLEQSEREELLAVLYAASNR
jgi:hypothetical protein